MKKPTIIETLHGAVEAALSPLGFRSQDIAHSPRGLSVPSAGIVVVLKLSESPVRQGKTAPDVRVWSATEQFTVSNLDGDEKQGERILFELPMGREWQVARTIALTVAQRRIDAAIDAATG